MKTTPQQNRVLWGQLFEVAVKRGVLAHLVQRELVKPEHPALRLWKDVKTSRLYAAMRAEMELVDDNAIKLVNRGVAHVLVLGYGLGWTCIREYLKRISDATRNRMELRGLWCPLSLPSTNRDRDEEAKQALADFRAMFELPEDFGPGLTMRGHPVWSDFTLLLGTPPKYADELLCLEFSYNALDEMPDFEREDAHLDELIRYARFLDSRGVFSRVYAQVQGEHYELSRSIAAHLGAFTSRDKPFFKMCQGASYVDTTVELLKDAGKLTKPCLGRVIAVTSNGFESFSARFDLTAAEAEPRLRLMRQFGEAYRQVIKVSDEEAEERLTDEVAMVFNQLVHALPSALGKQVRALAELPKPGEDISFSFTEAIEGFVNSMHLFSPEQAIELVDEDDSISELLGGAAKERIGALLASRMANGQVPLRGLHAAAVVAALKATTRKRMNVLALEGNPGIGKTTAVREYLMNEAQDGYLFLYVSPRVVINKDVTGKFAQSREGAATGILTVTTNATLIRTAAAAYHKIVVAAGGEPRTINSAAVVDGVEELVKPAASIWFIDPMQEEQLENTFAGPRLRKESLNERKDLVRERQLPGVLQVLARSGRELLDANPEVNRLVLTAAMQGYREMPSGGSTINALSRLFDNTNPKTKAGMAERFNFAKRIPNIVVMIDEVAGDGTGALFVNDVARWLDAQFLEPFDNAPEGPPFKVTLVVSDASLGNEVVLDRYLNSGVRAPDKVLVSASDGGQPFRMTATNVLIGNYKKPVFHVMTNSFPASELCVDYRIKLSKLEQELRDDGTPKTVRERVKSQAADLLLARAREEIYRALKAGAPQVIYFAQDKEFLRDLKTALHSSGKVQISGKEILLVDQDDDVELRESEIAILDSSVMPKARKDLVEEKTRDSKRVFLMTSSGARGVSFPKATWILAAVPRFNIESSLMEVAQLIYRGRGEYHDPLTGTKCSGDDVPRRLVMLVDDFVLEEDLDQDLRAWLKRSSDLLTLVMMLRSAIYTRIGGDAGLPGKDLALVPVGQIGSSELLSTMSQALQEFLKEAGVFLRESHPKDQLALVGAARQNVDQLFSTFRLDAFPGASDTPSFTLPEHLDDLVYLVTQEVSPLLPSTHGNALALPENVSCIGPFWLEDWSEFEKLETLTFDKYKAELDKLERELRGQLWALSKNQSLSPQLRRPAREIYRILAREAEEARREFSTVKPLASKLTWLALPLDYPRFWRKADPEQGTRTVLGDEEAWRVALGKSLQANGEILPVLPRYEDFPYAASVGVPDPARLEQVFDDRYFMVSSELNLLNTLLLCEDSRSTADRGKEADSVPTPVS